MSQQNVFTVLYEKRKGMSAKEIHRELETRGIFITLNNVTQNLSKLVWKDKSVLRYYPYIKMNQPRYILREHATQKMFRKCDKRIEATL